MNGRIFFIGLRAALAIVTVTLFVTSARAQAPWEKVLYSFNGAGGGWPWAGLVFDTRGNLYGTAAGGASNCAAGGCGTVFQLSHKVGGGWTYTVLRSLDAADGFDPYAGVIFDPAGNLYGTTVYGGAYGVGTVFELRQQGVRRWTEKLLYSFNGENGDGGNPLAALIFDAAGNLYGTTGEWGTNFDYYGTVFELSPEAGGGWTETVLYVFNSTDGSQPSGLIFDTDGHLYGTTSGGGAYGYGTVFELSPEAGGGWTEKVLHSFDGTDGAVPLAGLIFDPAGNLYGTTWQGGDLTQCDGRGCGTVFELSTNADGSWTETILHSFDPKCHNDGVNPGSGVIFDAAGHLYGTTVYGGAYGYGTVFEITP